VGKGETRRILVTGAVGQIGSELTLLLRSEYGNENVLASDLRHDIPQDVAESGPFESLDVTNVRKLRDICDRYEIDTIYHLAAILSGSGERNPDLAWHVNMDGLKNVLDVAHERDMARVIVPSSIAVFGPTTPREQTPQETLLRPTSIYGVTKVAGELLCDYYYSKWGLDVRGVRYPGLISWKTPPGGGTTDYAVEIFHEAIKTGRYTCFVKPETTLPMMYMPDALRALVKLARADGSRLRHRNAYNLASFSFSAAELADAIKRQMPEFEISYEPDYRQAIAEGWPSTIDDSAAQEDWDWKPEFSVEDMVADMLENLRRELKET
jgi:nucleoside-diphosphate-sugar epimerase